MNYLFLDSSPNKDQQLAFSRSASPKILDKMEERDMKTPSHNMKGSLFALPVLEKEQVDIKQSNNELLVLVNKMKNQLVGKKDDEPNEEEEEEEETNTIEFSDLNMGTQFYMGSLSVIGLYILYKLLLKTK
jgi:hypothetical protein